MTSPIPRDYSPPAVGSLTDTIRKVSQHKANPNSGKGRFHREAAHRSGFTGSFDKSVIPTDPFEGMGLRKMEAEVKALQAAPAHAVAGALVRAETTAANALSDFQGKISRAIASGGWSGRTAQQAAGAVGTYHQSGSQVVTAIALLNERASDLAELISEVRNRFPPVPASAPAADIPVSGATKSDDHAVDAATIAARTLLTGTYRPDAIANNTGIPAIPAVIPVVGAGPEPGTVPNGGGGGQQRPAKPPVPPKQPGGQQPGPQQAQPQPESVQPQQVSQSGGNGNQQQAGGQPHTLQAGVQPDPARPGGTHTTGIPAAPWNPGQQHHIPQQPPAAQPFGPPIHAVAGGASGAGAGTARPGQAGMPGGMVPPRRGNGNGDKDGEHKTASYLYSAENGRIVAGLDQIPLTAPPVIGGPNPAAQANEPEPNSGATQPGTQPRREGQ